MALNPPFNVEGQTDEDFFDKQVEDDMEPVKSGQDEGNDSDDANTFANVGIGYVDGSIEKPNGGESVNEVKEEKSSLLLDAGLVAALEGDGNSMFPMSAGNDSRMEPNNDGKGSEATLALAGSKSNEITSSGVKEVDWNSFYADRYGGIGFGSYSDFCNELSDQSRDFPGGTCNNLTSEVSSHHENQNVGLDNSNNYEQYKDICIYGKKHQ